MLKFLSNMILGDFNKRELARLQPYVEKINALEPETKSISDEGLRAKTNELRQRAQKGEDAWSILPEAFAVCREASVRVTGMRHFDVQLIGGMVLFDGNIAEMKTGEGKTLAATLPAYLQYIMGGQTHIITVNDYLASRDSEWMGQIYSFLGLDVGLIVHGLTTEQRRQSYAAAVVYGTNNEFGFDYLRDNMVVRAEHLVQGKLDFAIIDEVDSILIDEARTPLIISGPGDESTDLYYRFAQVVRMLKEEEDYTVDEKAKTVVPTETGIEKVERIMGVDNLYDDQHKDLSHYLNQALKAKCLFKRDGDYIVKDNEVVIVDDFTGRLMFGRRYSDGLHQAIEAKENVKVERENQTVATITIQNFFRMYDRLAGMTGTAVTEEEEFRKIYGMDVVVIPTNEPMVREDLQDVVFRTGDGKFGAVVQQIKECHRRGQPVLVGTVSVERSEYLSSLLRKEGIPHEVLNAKNHEREAEIVSKAGQPGAVTISTNMAGRGTDIVLGEGVAELGGLMVLGTERHESRRIDNQLRGRSGRQGDLGASQFYIAMEDDLMRLFGAENIAGLLDSLGMDDSQPIDHPMLSRAIERAQKRVEGRNFNIRERVLQYDDVLNQQRDIIYKQRRQVLEGLDMKEQVLRMVEEAIDNALALFVDDRGFEEDWNLAGLVEYLESMLFPAGILKEDSLRKMAPEEIRDLLLEKAAELYEAKEEKLGSETMRELERIVMLRVVDQKWMAHLDAMDDLREGISLRAYGQQNPLIEYQREAFAMFNEMIENVQEDVVKLVFKLEVVDRPAQQEQRRLVFGGPAPGAERSEPKKQAPVQSVKIGRNDPCPCGSGKKYKKCCGKVG